MALGSTGEEESLASLSDDPENKLFIIYQES